MSEAVWYDRILADWSRILDAEPAEHHKWAIGWMDRVEEEVWFRERFILAGIAWREELAGGTGLTVEQESDLIVELCETLNETGEIPQETDDALTEIVTRIGIHLYGY